MWKSTKPFYIDLRNFIHHGLHMNKLQISGILLTSCMIFLCGCAGPVGIITAAPKSLIDGTASFWSSATGEDLTGKDTEIKKLKDQLSEYEKTNKVKSDFIRPRLYSKTKTTEVEKSIEHFNLAYDNYTNNTKPSNVITCFKIASKNSREAQFNLGALYYEGKRVQRNLVEALKWWGLATKKGDPRAEFWLGIANSRATDKEKEDAELLIKRKTGITPF